MGGWGGKFGRGGGEIGVVRRREEREERASRTPRSVPWMPVNIGSGSAAAAGLTTAAVGAGYYGAKRLGWVDDGTLDRQKERLEEIKAAGDNIGAVAAELVKTSACATAAGWFQVYSGGIMIDTVATRMQAGSTLNSALWGLHRDAPVGTVVTRFVRRSAYRSGGVASLAMKPHQVYAGMILRSNLTAGHFVTMLSRFPYLVLNFSTYQQTERLLYSMRSTEDSRAQKGIFEELACVSTSTLVSTTAITMAECPKIRDQVHGRVGQGRSTIGSVYREYGLRRLFQGYTACFCREYLFNVALLGSPGVAKVLHNKAVSGDLGVVGSAVEGHEIVVASMALGLPMGFLTNFPDMLKTNIQTGQFLNMREAWAWQSQHGGGLRGIYGRAAVWRGGFIMHCVVAFNFARDRVEQYIG